MKRDVMRSAVERFLAKKGFGQGTWHWSNPTAELLLLVNDHIRPFKFSSRMSVKEVWFQLGRLEAIAEMLNLKPRQYGNGSAALYDEGHQLALPVMGTA